MTEKIRATQMRKPQNIRYFLLLVMAFLTCEASAQLVVTEGSAMNMTPQQLIQEWFIGEGITVSNATFNGSSAVITSTQVGTFTTQGTATTELKIDAGILLTCGKASIAIGPNNAPNAGSNTGGSGDPDLNMLSGSTTFDKGVIEFDFIPQSDTVRFNYVFGSEEFDEYCGSYNDAFGFFLSGPGISGSYSNNAKNIALMPGSASQPVTINNICNNQFCSWNNAGGVNFQYDRLTNRFIAWSAVIPCSTYHIKLAIGDAVDHIYDSGVFLQKNSFSSTVLNVGTSFSNPLISGVAVEGCADATVSFVISQTSNKPYVIRYDVLGTATRGVDYTDIPDSLVIPPGQDSTALVIHPVYDSDLEGQEYVLLKVHKPSCSGPQYQYDTVYIDDNAPLLVQDIQNSIICNGDSITLVAHVSGGHVPYFYQWNVPNGANDSVTVYPPIGHTWYVVEATDACQNTDLDSVMIITYPPPEIWSSLDFGYCSGATTNATFIGNIPDMYYFWTATNPGGHVTGYGPGDGTAIRQTLYMDNQAAIDSVIYKVTPTKGNCIGPDTTVVITMFLAPSVTFSSALPHVCSGDTTEIFLLSNINNATFSWTASASSSNVSGHTGGSGDVIRQRIVKTGTGVDTLRYFVTATALGCDGVAEEFSILVTPRPKVNLPADTVVCVYDSIILNAGNPGFSFLWSTGDTVQTIMVATTGLGYDLQTYSVMVGNAFGCNDADSISVLFSYEECVGIGEQAKPLMTLFPNPTTGRLNVVFTDPPDKGELVVINLYGEEVAVHSIGQIPERVFTFDLSGIPSGIYFLGYRGTSLIKPVKFILSGR